MAVHGTSRRAVLAGALALAACGPARQAVRAPGPEAAAPPAPGLQRAVLAGGCFWGVQGVFAHVKGVRGAVSGYAGGAASDADYRRVSTGRTGHAEAVEVTFDPEAVSYGEILQIFFSVATDPTQVDQQWPDVGPQYRNEIFYADEAQRRIAEAYIAQLERARVFPLPIATRVSPLNGFYPAEADHQDYMFKNPRAPYIVMHDAPKLRALKAQFPDRWRDQPVRWRGA